eukprot:389519-Amphidinium_carterae.2
MSAEHGVLYGIVPKPWLKADNFDCGHLCNRSARLDASSLKISTKDSSSFTFTALNWDKM